MLPQMLAMVIKGGPEGGTVDIGIAPFVVGSLPFIIAIVSIVTGSWFALNKKRLEHQQILAAIEKGTPLSELRPPENKGPDWIKSLSVGIAFLLMGIGMAIVASISIVSGWPDKDAGFGLCIASMVLLAIGTGGLTRGILLRKAEKALSDKSALDANQGQ